MHRQQPTIYAPDTNMAVVYGNAAKVRRNRKVSMGLFQLNVRPIQSGRKPIEMLNDPLHRRPDVLVQRAREEASIAGRARAYMRPAAPAQVQWKNRYTDTAKTRRPIGPVFQQQQKSILYRLSGALGAIGKTG